MNKTKATKTKYDIIVRIIDDANTTNPTKSMYKWTDKAKQDALGKFARNAARLLVNGISLEELKTACDLAVASQVTHS